MSDCAGPSTKADLFAIARLEGADVETARKRAGYKGRPPSDAYSLAEAAISMRRHAGEWSQVEHYQMMVADLSARLSNARTLLRAAELLAWSEETQG